MIHRVLLTVALIAFCGVAQAQNTARVLNLPGVYKGQHPCADCRGLTATLTIKCTSPCRSGSYTLMDKYIDSPEGEVINHTQGKWSITDKGSDLVLILNKNNPANTSYYFVKKDGNLQPLDKDQQPMEIPYDIVMRKQ